MAEEEETQKPSAAFEAGYSSGWEKEIGTAREDKGISDTLKSFVLGVLFGVVLPLVLKVLLGEFVELLAPSETVPTLGEGTEYTGAVDLTSTQPMLDQLTEKLATYTTILWAIALIYLFPIIYQVRVAVIFGKLVDTFCLALTLLGPPLVLFILPMWGEVLA